MKTAGKTSFTLYCLYSWPLWVPEELGSVQAAVWSPVGSAMAMVRDNNIYYRETMDHMIEKITTTGEVGSLYNGVPDWLYGGNILSNDMFNCNIIQKRYSNSRTVSGFLQRGRFSHIYHSMIAR